MVPKEVIREEASFKRHKIILIVLHALILIAVPIYLVTFIVKISVTDHKHQENLIGREADIRKIMEIFYAFVFVFMFINEIIALVGIIKENKNIVITYLILSLMGFASNLIYEKRVILNYLLVILLTAQFAYLLIKRDRNVV